MLQVEIKLYKVMAISRYTTKVEESERHSVYVIIFSSINVASLITITPALRNPSPVFFVSY